jgi:hypothetical protein
LEQVVHDPSAVWNRHPPAEARDVEALREELPALPESFLAFLRLSNGGEGELADEPGWFQLWPAEEVVSRNRDYGVDEFLPGFIGFGSDGGGELLAFAPNREVVMVPFILMDSAAAREMARDFRSLAGAFGRVDR